jgi:hypothetical protein
MKQQLQQLYCLVSVAGPELATYLEKHESGNMFFCFRWLLVLFKREFSHQDIMKLWEVLWTDLPCPNFHLLLCVAILDTQQHFLVENNYGFTEILKVIPWMYNIYVCVCVCARAGRHACMCVHARVCACVFFLDIEGVDNIKINLQEMGWRHEFYWGQNRDR